MVDDLTVEYLYRNEHDIRRIGEDRAYGPLRAKLLARFQPIRGDFQTGYYVQRNGEKSSRSVFSRDEH